MQSDDGGEPLVERAVDTGGSTNSNAGGGEEEAGEGAGVLPWSAEALQAAAALGKERDRRSANYGKREPQGKVGAPAPFGRSEPAHGAEPLCVFFFFFACFFCGYSMWYFFCCLLLVSVSTSMFLLLL